MVASDSAAFAVILLLLVLVLGVLASGGMTLVGLVPRVGRRRSLARAATPTREEPPVPAALERPDGTSLHGLIDEGPPAEAEPDDSDDPRPPAPLVLWTPQPLVWIPPPRRGRTRYPVVLAHGFAGFDAVKVSGLQLAYFRGVADRLRAAGFEVHVLRVSPVAPIAHRARQLAEQVRRLPADRCNVVAHSMGGLDARYALAALGLGDRVASLTTIGTPHRGTPLADLGVFLLGGALGRLGVPVDAFRDLTTESMEGFNQEARDAPGVVYRSFVASARQVNAVLVPSHRFLRLRAGENDGVVPASSQRWGEVLGEIDVDHWGAVGWSSRFDAGAFYEDLSLGLGARGL